ncbi:MAG: metallophosphoesterase [Lachnospiraceae bacterium]|nr:metallophosphoesterase [Lachnospiraceae bacterium]
MSRYKICRIAIIGAAALIVLAVVVWLASGRDTSDNIADEAEENDEPAIEAAVQESVSDSDSVQVVYPAPEYDFNTEEIIVEIEGLENEYKIAFVNDLHMITDHESGDVTEDNMATVEARYEEFVTSGENPIHSEELWPEIIKFLNYNDFDAVIFAGDMLDYCSNSNITALKTGLEELKYPSDKVMYIRSDHDYGGWYGGNGFTDTAGFILQSLVLDADASEKLIEFDEFMIVGINQSYRNISANARQRIEGRLDGEKPVLVATHVPFYSNVDSSLEELSMEVRNKIYYWSPEGVNYVPDEETQALIDKMYAENTNVEQILAAHIHASWDGYVTDSLKEHVFAPAFQGNIGIIYVMGGNES